MGENDVSEDDKVTKQLIQGGHFFRLLFSLTIP